MVGLQASFVVSLKPAKPAQPAIRCTVKNGRLKYYIKKEPQIKRRQDKINDVANSGCVQKK